MYKAHTTQEYFTQTVLILNSSDHRSNSGDKKATTLHQQQVCESYCLWRVISYCSS